MISVIFAVMLQTLPQPTDPVQQWVHCLYSHADRLEPSGESAAAISDVALAQCIAFQNYVQAQNRAEIANHPDREMRSYADRGSQEIISEVRSNFRTMTMERVMTVRARRASN